MLSVWGEPVVSPSLDCSLPSGAHVQTELSDLTSTPVTVHPLHTHVQTQWPPRAPFPPTSRPRMAPTVTTARLRATWYVLNTLSFQFRSVALERAKVAAAAAAAAAAEMAIGNRARGFRALEQHSRRRRRQDTVHAADTPDSGTPVYLKDTSGHVDASILNN